MGQFNASPCPNLSGLISLMFKAYFLFYLLYQVDNTLFSDGQLGSNFWMIENEGKLHKSTSNNLMSEFHLDGDIRLRVGNSFN